MKMNMKKIISWGMMLAAAFTLTNCAKEIDAPVQEPESVGYPFEIIASTVDTKTVNHGMSTKWVAEDQINLFHAVGDGEDYKNNGAFTVKDVESGNFAGNLCEELDPQEEYDWYAIYPYSSYIKTPGQQTNGYTYIGSRSDTPQSQTGVDNMNHIAGEKYPLYGKAVAVGAGVKPELTMYHASTLLQINVTNTLDEELSVENISFTAPEGTSLVGTFYLDITGDKVDYADGQYVSNVANLSVSDATIAPEATASFYLAVKPFTAVNESELKIAVNGYEKTLAMSKDVTFTAGKIKTLNFGYDYVAPAGEQSVTFDFTSADELNALGVTLPNPSAGTSVTTLTKGDVIFVADGGSTKTRVYNSSGKYDLRAYKGATLTFSAPSGYVISDVILTGSATTSISTSVMPSNPVVLTVAANADTQKISTITVKYVEGEVVAVPLTMGAVTCVNQTTNSLTFSWDEVSGAEGYKVSLDGGNNWSDQFDATSYTWESLDSASEYTIYVKAVGNGINTLDSEAVSANGTTEVEQAGVVTNSVEFTFTGSNGQNDFTVAQPPIKIAFAKAEGSNAPYDHSDKHVRFYNGNTMTFTGGTIVKIELKYSNKSYPGTGTTANVGTLSQDTNAKMWTWIGKNTTVTLTGGSKQGRYDSITVYYESDGTLPDPVQLTMSNVTCSAQTANSLTFKWDAVEGAVGYEVSFNGGDVETVNEPTYTANELTAETTYSISVKAVGDGTYYLTSDAVSADGTTLAEQSGDEPAWTLVTDASTLTAGDQVVIVAKESNYALSTTQTSNNRGQASVVKSGNNITFGSDVQVLTLQAGKTSGTFAFYTGVGYLYAASSSSNYLRTETTLSANSSWNISITSAGVATVKATGTNTRNWMRYNSSSKIFACYSSGQADILIYRYQ